MPLWLWLIFLVVCGIGYLVRKVVASSKPLDPNSYTPSVGPIVRRYPRRPADPMATLGTAIARVPKARIANQSTSAIFVNLGASVGRLDDGFGLFVRVVSRLDVDAWVITVDGQPRVGSTSRAVRSTLQAFERELRRGLGELGYRVDDGLAAPPLDAPTPRNAAPATSGPGLGRSAVIPPPPPVPQPASPASVPTPAWNGLPTPGRDAPSVPLATPMWVSPPASFVSSSAPLPTRLPRPVTAAPAAAPGWATAPPSVDSNTPRPSRPSADSPGLVLTILGERRLIRSMAVIGRNPVVRPGDPVDTERIVISDPLASKTHVAVGGDHLTAWIEDRRSVNGVTVVSANGTSRLLVPARREPLHIGDVIRIGDQSLVVSSEEGLT